MVATPEDHKKPAAQIEAEGDATATLTHGDLVFVVPADMEDVDGDILLYAADRDAYRIVRTLLDEKQFAAFHATKPKVRDYRALGDQIAKLYGFEDLGN